MLASVVLDKQEQMANPRGCVRLLLVDDHAVVRAGYRTLLQHSPEIEIVAEADSGESACRAFVACEPDVVVMDLSLPGMGGLEAIRRIVSRDHRAKILVFSMHDDTAFVEQALHAGAKGYVTKSSAPEVLADAVKAVAEGKVYLDHKLAQDLAVQKVRGRSDLLAQLSTREFEIFCLLAEGLSAAEVAKRLCLSAKTVANYNTQIKSKLGVRSTGELIHLAIRHGIVKPGSARM